MGLKLLMPVTKTFKDWLFVEDTLFATFDATNTDMILWHNPFENLRINANNVLSINTCKSEQDTPPVYKIHFKMIGGNTITWGFNKKDKFDKQIKILEAWD